jgi:putative hydrolase of the HAD superfamily
VIRAVTLDAAGTLFAPSEPVGVTYARVARRHGIAADPAGVEARFRRALRAAPPLAFPGTTASGRALLERAWWLDVVRTALSADDATPPRLAACFEALFAHYARADAWTVFADVPPALAALRSHGVRLAVVSNFDGRLPGVLDGLGLGGAFDAVVWSSAAGAAKPDPAIFEAAAGRLEVDTRATWHVGDDPHADVGGARAAGATAVLLDRHGATADAIATLAELVPLLVARQA